LLYWGNWGRNGFMMMMMGKEVVMGNKGGRGDGRGKGE
jgi:hypothetical protein